MTTDIGLNIIQSLFLLMLLGFIGMILFCAIADAGTARYK